MKLDPASPLIAEATFEDATLTVLLAQDINVMNAPEARSTLMRLVKDHKPQRLVLDMRDVGFLDSSAMGVLVELRKTMPAGGTIALTNLVKAVRGLMRIMRLEALFEIAGEDA